MKKIFCLLLVLIIIIIPFVSAAESQDTSVVVYQYNSNYAGWGNTSPTHYGNLVSGANKYPVSLITTKSNLGVLANTTIAPETVDVYISNPAIYDGAIVYCGLINAYGAFVGTDTIDTIFNWDNSIPGYVPRYSSGSTMGYINPSNYITCTAPTNFSVGTQQLRSGSSSYARTLTNTVVSTWTGQIPVPASNGTGSVYNEPYYITAASSYRTVRVITTAPAQTNEGQVLDTVRFRFDTADLVTCRTTAATGSTYLHSAIFVPVALVIPNSGFDESVIADLDSIVSNLADLTVDVGSISVDVNAIASYLYDGDASVISALAELVEMLTFIRNGMVPVTTVSGHRWNSSIQYIEYYLSQVLYYDTHIASDTNTIVQQLNDITSTLTNIANTIQAANDQADAINESSEDIHEAEEEIFEDANDAIGSTVISSFAFDPDTSAGMGRVGIDFTNLWNALGNWHNVYIFSMTLTLAFTIIRFSSARSRAKNRDNKSKGE